MTTIEDQDRISVISKRDFERKLNIQKQRDIKESTSAKNEKIDFFEQEFMAKSAEIEALLNLSTNLSASHLSDHFNVIFKDLLILQKYVAASNLFLRTYDIKKCNDTLHVLTNKAKELEDKLLPKKKFGFKNKSRLINCMETSMSHSWDEPDSSEVSRRFPLVDENSTGYSERSNESLCLKEDQVFKKDVTISAMSKCNIKIFGSPSTLHLDSLKDCTVLCGPVSTSVFASNCETCTLVIACQQLRLHCSKDVTIYLHVTSRAIMEDCTNILFAPYNFKYKDIGKHFDQSGLDISVNNWQGIDDFDWLKTNQQSPHWKVLEESERHDDWD